MTKNIIITKKQWYLKTIYEILENAFLDDFRENRCGIIYSDDEFGRKEVEPTGEITEENFDIEEYYYYEALDFIKNEIDLSDDLTIINGIGGERDKQIGMIEFINLFSDLNFKLEDFKIEKDEKKIKINYLFKKPFNFKNYDYEYLSTFFNDFLTIKAEKILDEVIEFNNNK